MVCLKTPGIEANPLLATYSRRLPRNHPLAAKRHPVPEPVISKWPGLFFQAFNEELMAGTKRWQDQRARISPA